MNLRYVSKGKKIMEKFAAVWTFIFNLLKIQKKYFYLILITVWITLFLITYFKNFFSSAGINIDTLTKFSHYTNPLIIVITVSIICIFIFELLDYIKVIINKKRILKNLSRLDTSQCQILIGCYKKDAQFFNYNTYIEFDFINNSYEFNTLLPPLLASKVVVEKRFEGLSPTHQINDTVWSELERILPPKNDLLTWDKIKLSEIMDNLKTFDEMSFKSINIKSFKEIEQKYLTIKNTNFECTKANNILKEVIQLLEENITKLNDNYYVKYYNSGTFTIFNASYVGDQKELKWRLEFENNCRLNAKGCVTKIVQLSEYFNCLKLIKSN